MVVFSPTADKKCLHLATCEECLHYEVCDQSSRQRWALMAGEKECSDFKDLAKYAEVVHAEWIKEGPYTSVGGECKKALMCPVCFSYFVSDGNKPWHLHNYCPNCGAKMDGGTGR